MVGRCVVMAAVAAAVETRRGGRAEDAAEQQRSRAEDQEAARRSLHSARVPHSCRPISARGPAKLSGRHQKEERFFTTAGARTAAQIPDAAAGAAAER
jgi:hypothetical protein